MLEILLGVVFLAIFRAAPEPTTVVTREDAEACFAAGNVVINVYVGETAEEAIDNGEAFCFVIPEPEEIADAPVPEQPSYTPVGPERPSEPTETERQ